MAQFRRKYPRLSAKHEDYFRGLIISAMDVCDVKDHPLRPWQQALYDKLQGPISDTEVIYVIDKTGNAGKSHFVDWYIWKHSNSFFVGADKRDDVSYLLINEVVENGSPRVVFMDAPRSHNAYISSSFLEELKNGKIISPKYTSKRCCLENAPHAVVMTNSFPVKTACDAGLSDDRYTYLFLEGDKYCCLHGSNGSWFHSNVFYIRQKEAQSE